MEPLVPRADARDRLVLDERPGYGWPIGLWKGSGDDTRLPCPLPVRSELRNRLFAAVPFAQGGKPSGQVHPDMQEVDDNHPVWRGNKDHIVLSGAGIT